MNLRNTLLRYSFFFFCLSGSCHQNTICVALTVKDDDRTIRECLKSVADIADCISICDLGSTDWTIDIINTFLKTTGIPGKIHQRTVQDPSYTQVISAEAAKKTLRAYGFDLSTSYLLMLEPDQILSAGSPLTETLVEPSYLVLEKSWLLSCSHYAPRLFRASIRPEDIQCDGKKRTAAKVKSLTIEEQVPHVLIPESALTESETKEYYRDGLEKYRVEKVAQNIERYKEILSADPDNPIYLFYLAQSHKSLKQYEEAIAQYGKQLEKQSDPESVWFAKYMLGECNEEMGQWVHALYWYLEAYQFDPARAEPLRKIATYYRLRGESNLSYIFAKYGVQIPKAQEALLFSSPLYDYQFDEELSIAAYYTQFKEDGYAASSDLLLRRGAPYYIRDQGYKNLLYYIQNIKARFVPIQIPLPPVNPGSEETYRPMNPSIMKTDEGYKLICRSVNYTQTGAKHFHTNDAGGIFRTRNFLVHYDRSFQKIAHHEIVEDLDRERCRDYIVKGLEDCRLFHFKESDWFTCSTFDTNPSGAIQISLCKMKDEGLDLPVQVETLVPMKGPDPNRHEKNWLPFVKNRELFFIYSSDPFVIYKPDLETGECASVLSYTPTHDFSQFRGSAPPIAFDGGHLMMVHEVILNADYTRCYIHRLVFLDQAFKVTKVSKPFTFMHSGIEYCLSMTIDHEENQLVIPIGIEDREAYLAFIDLNEIRTMLQPLPPVYNPY